MMLKTWCRIITMQVTAKKLFLVGIVLAVFMLVYRSLAVLVLPRLGFLAWLNTEYPSSFAYENLVKLAPGMSKDEVFSVVGEPFVEVGQDLEKGSYSKNYSECFSYSRKKGFEPLLLELEVPWISIRVCFDETGRYVRTSKNRFWN